MYGTVFFEASKRKSTHPDFLAKIISKIDSELSAML
jgi:hypothetical protein